MPGLPGIPLLPQEPGPWTPIQRLICRHIASSQEMILAAAQGLSGAHALVIGAGPCADVPLRALAQQFEQVSLVDSDGQALHSARRSLRPALRPRVSCTVMDVLGFEAPFLAHVDQILAQAHTPERALAQLVELTQAGGPDVAPGSARPRQLVLAPCVLSQLGIRTLQATLLRFAQAFPELGDAPLRSSPVWVNNTLRLTHTLQRAFVAGLRDRVTEDGRVWISATSQVAELRLDAYGRWTTQGFYRMLAAAQLDEILGPGWKVLARADWPWVVPPAPTGEAGLLYRVEALTLVRC